MDNRHFDHLAKRVAAGSSRRTALRLLGGSALAAGLTRRGLSPAAGQFGTEDDRDANCRGSCAQCDGDGQCCSGRCDGGACQCKERGSCSHDRACCSGRCRDGTCKRAPDPGCCQEAGERCGRDADCCGHGTRERTVCLENFPAPWCPKTNGKVCCRMPRGACKDDCECCYGYSCHCGHCRNLEGENDFPCSAR